MININDIGFTETICALSDYADEWEINIRGGHGGPERIVINYDGVNDIEIGGVVTEPGTTTIESEER